MKSFRRIIPILCLLFVAGYFSSCSNKGIHKTLLRVEDLMDSDPQAARDVLESLARATSSWQLGIRNADENHAQPAIPHSSFLIPDFTRKGDRALYAWLSTLADYECGIPLTTDSLARIATIYYGIPRHPDHHAAMAWYTLGCVYRETADDSNSTDAFLTAKSLFPDTVNRYYALSEQNIGLSYMNRSMTEEAIQELLHAKKLFLWLEDSVTVAILDLQLAQCYLCQDEIASAEIRLNRILVNPHAPDDVIRDTYMELAKLEVNNSGFYSKAHRYADRSIRFASDKEKLAATYSQKANIFQEQGQIDSAWHYYHRSLSCQPDFPSFAFNYSQMASLATQVGKSDSIPYFIKQHDHFIDTLYALSNQQAIRQVVNDHRVEMEQQRLANAHRRLLWMLGLTGLLLTIIVLIIVVWSLNLSNRRKQQYISLSDQLKKAQMEEERRRIELAQMTQQNQKFQDDYREACGRIEALESMHDKNGPFPSGRTNASSAKRVLCLTDYERRIRICVTQFRKSPTWALVQKYLHGSAFFLTKDERAAICHDLDVCFNDFFDILHDEGRKVISSEKKVAACYILGFTSEVTEEILGINDSTVRGKKHNMKEKLPEDLYKIIFNRKNN